MKTAIITVLALLLLAITAFAAMVCPQCGKTYPDDFAYCDDDGTKLVKKPSPKPQPEEPQTKIVGPGIKMVRIPGGTFLMGSNEGDEDEKPVRQVCVDSFWISETEITVGQYVAFLNKHAAPYPDFLITTKQIKKDSNGFHVVQGWENKPVTFISWEEARAFCKAYPLRLPTEEEWEYTAGGPKHYKYPWGNVFDKDQCCNKDNHNNNFTALVMDVRSFTPNGFGLFDMAGNVWEWNSNWYNVIPEGHEEKLLGVHTYKVIRGGSSTSNSNDLRCSNRSKIEINSTPNYQVCGLRVVGD